MGGTLVVGRALGAGKGSWDGGRDKVGPGVGHGVPREFAAVMYQYIKLCVLVSAVT